MNIQEKTKNGKLLGRGIQWTDYTANPVAGCKHRCRWTMPDGSTAICYAEEVAQGVAGSHYPHGFEHNYWHPHRLEEPLKLKQPAKIFMDSMSDLFGMWMPREQVLQVLDMARRADWHIFQSLTKAAPQLLKYKDEIPANVWVGVSSPPDSMFGQALTREQQRKMLERTLQVLSEFPDHVTWISFEPLSWDVSDIVAQYPGALRWAVVGAATNGPTVYQPNPEHVRRLLAVLDEQAVPVFFKGNLEGNEAAPYWEWREYFPGYVPSKWQESIRRGLIGAHNPLKLPRQLAARPAPQPATVAGQMSLL